MEPLAFGLGALGLIGALVAFQLPRSPCDAALLVCLGLMALVGLSEPWRARRRDARTLYAVTDRRVLAWFPSTRPEVALWTWRPGEVASVARVDLDDSRAGSLLLARSQTELRTHPPMPDGLLRVANVREVETLARAVLAQQPDPSTLPTKPGDPPPPEP
ncbi:MAG: hypothetical protein M9894_02460 [Planctomycetes bacterium]|nr:hypothetical protein [Planctomycetota bacterium]